MLSFEQSVFVTLHPDDAETMLGYAILQAHTTAHVIVASDGEATTINRTAEPCFCRIS